MRFLFLKSILLLDLFAGSTGLDLEKHEVTAFFFPPDFSISVGGANSAQVQREEGGRLGRRGLAGRYFCFVRLPFEGLG